MHGHTNVKFVVTLFAFISAVLTIYCTSFLETSVRMSIYKQKRPY